MAEQMLRANRVATLEVLSPVHVGPGGDPLLLDYDFARERGTVWVMDMRKLLERFDDEQLRHGVPDVRLSKVLGTAGYASCAAYSLSAPGVECREILPAIKDVEGRPYLPGSSIKGALRTVVAWVAAREPQWTPTEEELLADDERRPGRPVVRERADDRWERRVFGPTPNRDLMRALLVDDTAPVPLDRLELAVVSVYSRRGGQLVAMGGSLRFYVEALRPGTVLPFRIGVAQQLLSHPRLGFGDRRGWIDRLAQLARERAMELIDGERAYYAQVGPRPLLHFYDRLKERARALRENELLLQMAWGAGWGAKTLGRSLSSAPYFPMLLERYRLRGAGPDFPKSRRLVERGGAATEPLGWVKVTL